MTWGAVLGFGALWLLTRWGFGNAPDRWQEIVYPFALPFAYLALSPVPWQWSGDDRPLAGVLRGLLQAIPWNLVWVVSISLMLGMSRGTDRRGPGPGQGQGRHGYGAAVRPAEPAPLLPPRLVALSIANLSFALLLGWILADKERAERQESHAVRAAALAQARALQAQMNPHVLFNAISGLTELVHEDPQAAEEALVSLATLLRGLLEHGARVVAPLGAERALVAQYLALETIRLGDRLRVSWDWDARLESCELPPLLLQPLVENAIKHGVAPNRGGGELRIFLRREGSTLHLGVANTGRSPEGDPAEGVGLRNLRERLELLGEGAGVFRFSQEDGWTVAELRLEERA